MGKIKENWQTIVFTMILTLTGSYFLSKLQARDNSIENAASIEYVDGKDSHLQKQIDTKADKSTVEEMNQTLKVMDGRIYDLWKNNNQKDK